MSVESEVLSRFGDRMVANKAVLVDQFVQVSDAHISAVVLPDRTKLKPICESALDFVVAFMRGVPLDTLKDAFNAFVASQSAERIDLMKFAAIISAWKAVLVRFMESEVREAEERATILKFSIDLTERIMLWLSDAYTDRVGRTIERRSRETEALQSLYEDLLYNANDLIFSADEEGRVVFINMKGVDLLGRPADQILGKDIGELLPGEYKEFMSTQIKKNIKGSRTPPFEVEVPTKDGGQVWLEVNLSPSSPEEGPRRVWGIARDLTSRKKIEKGIITYSKELEETVEKSTKTMRMKDTYLSSVLNLSNDAIITIDLDMVITSWNRGAEGIFGYRVEDAIGKSYKMLIPPDLGIEFEEILNEVLKRGYIRNYETERLTASGNKVMVSTTLNIIEDANGEVMGFVGVIKDVTERKKMEQELRLSKAELQKANDELKRHNIQLEKDNIRLRDLLTIMPVKEKECVPTMAVPSDMKPGHVYLIKSDDPDAGLRHFANAVKRGAHGLCITRSPPERVRERYGLQKTPMLWLTSNRKEGEHCISPSGIGELSSSIIAFIDKAKDGIVVLTGIEYLISQNTFRPILNFIQLLNDKIMVSDSRFVFTIDPLALEERDLHMLLREAKEFISDGGAATDTARRYEHLVDRFEYVTERDITSDHKDG